MAAPSEREPRYAVTCPHCGRTFVAELLAGSAARYRGFKCPHCKLFVPYERADQLAAVEQAGSFREKSDSLTRRTFRGA
jgi:DNA-directed RNA polymerase subunit RPC12/RpoP